MFNFPPPTFVGQKYQPAAGMPVYGWDGTKWTTFTPDLASKVPASDANPVMDGVASTGSAAAYSRGGHVHPTDTSRAPINNPTFTGTLTAALLNVSGNVTVTGKVTSTVKGHKFGYARGTVATGAVTEADANIKFYDHRAQGSPGSWCGIGTDGNGEMWVRTGYSGTPAPIFRIQNDQHVVFRSPPYGSTPGAGDNSTRLATTAFVMARTPSGMYPLDASQTITGAVTIAGAELWVHNGGNYGVLYLGNTGSRYLVWDGSNYSFSGAHVYSANGRLWGTGDFSSPYTNARLALHGDYTHVRSSGPMTEPYAGSIQTGTSGSAGGGASNWVKRYRQLQYYTTSWFGIGHA